jgi:hypothetical protein
MAVAWSSGEVVRVTRFTKITRDEIIILLEKELGIKDIRFMRNGGYETDRQIIEDFDYIIGEKNE